MEKDSKSADVSSFSVPTGDHARRRLSRDLFSVRKTDDFVPTSHPLRSIRVMVNEALAKMDRIFAVMCEADIKGGRPSIGPQKLLREMLLQVLYS